MATDTAGDTGALSALAVGEGGGIHVDGCVELRLPEAAATSVGVGGVGTHGERSSDVVELAGIRRVQL